jgi:hypothetical protein
VDGNRCWWRFQIDNHHSDDVRGNCCCSGSNTIHHDQLACHYCDELGHLDWYCHCSAHPAQRHYLNDLAIARP